MKFVKRPRRGATRVKNTEVFLHLRANPGRTTREIAAAFDCIPDVIIWRLKSLRRRRLAELREPGHKGNPGRWYARQPVGRGERPTNGANG
jgi:hypothetical protein